MTLKGLKCLKLSSFKTDKASIKMNFKRIFNIAFFLFIILAPSLASAEAQRVAVLPWKVNSVEKLDFLKNAMTEMVSSRLGSKAGIEVVSADQVRAAIKEEKIEEFTDKAAADIAKRLKADYVVYGSLTVLGTAVSLDAKVLTVKTEAVSPVYSQGAGMDSVIPMTEKVSNEALLITGVIKASAPAKAETPATDAKEQKAEGDGFIIKTKEETAKAVSFRSKSIEGLYLSFIAADLDKDGAKELFLISERKLVIARIKGDGLEIIKEMPSDRGSDNIALTAIDSDKDGSVEVYLSAVLDNKPSTSVIEFKDNEYKVTVKDVRWLVRTFEVNGESVLAGQKFRSGDGFYADIRLLKKEGAEVADKGPFIVKPPKKTGLYSFDVFDLTGSGSSELISLDDRDYIKIYKGSEGKWTDPWKSKDYYGGTLNYIEDSNDGPGLSEKPLIAVKGRFYHTDMNRDGRPELIIKRNVPGGLGRSAERPGSYVSGLIMSLTWDKVGEDLVEDWKTREVKGYIADFIIDDLDGSGDSEIAMLIVEGTEYLMDTPKSYILFHKFSL